MKIMSRNATNIGVCTLDDFEKVKETLTREKVNYYTYTPKGLRPFSMVLEGLSDSYSSDDVMEYLSGLQIKLEIIRLANLNGDRWLLQVTRDSDIGAFYNVRYILRCRVKIRKFRRGAVTQCFNCQRFGHTSGNCHMPYRCVKCGGSHGPGKCEIPPKGENVAETLTTHPITGQVVRKTGLPVKCANCGVEGHTASSKQCPRRIELLRRVEAKRAAKGSDGAVRRFVDSGTRPGVSYASAVVGNTTAAGPTRTDKGGVATGMIDLKNALGQFDEIDRDCKRLFGNDFFKCLGKISGFMREYRTLDNDEAKSRALLGMLISLQHHG